MLVASLAFGACSDNSGLPAGTGGSKGSGGGMTGMGENIVPTGGADACGPSTDGIRNLPDGDIQPKIDGGRTGRDGGFQANEDGGGFTRPDGGSTRSGRDQHPRRENEATEQGGGLAFRSNEMLRPLADSFTRSQDRYR